MEEQIVYGSDQRTSAWRREIYVMDADGTNVRRVTTLPKEAAVYDTEAPILSRWEPACVHPLHKAKKSP